MNREVAVAGSCDHIDAMISALFKRNPKPASRRGPPEVPEQVVAWAVGDVHGRLDLLEPLVASIRADTVRSGARQTIVVFLGDYIDRGRDSRGVVEYLSALSAGDGIEWRFLKGNHEEAMLRFLEEPGFGPTWCEYGGDSALESYGLRTPDLKHRPEAWARLAADLDHKLSARERAFLENLELSTSVGDYFFAHAGARPGLALDRQTSKDLMWIRGSFLDSDVEFEKVVVHGHTPSLLVHSDHRRIGIDTKAYASGVLTALRLEGTDRTFVQAIERSGELHVETV